MGRVQRFCGLAVTTVFALLISGCALFNGSGPGSGGGGGGGGNGGGSGDITAVNHIIFMAQENRSFDTYFGKLNDYRASQGLPQEVDGMPADASNPADDGSMIHAFHFNTTCIENTSAAWATSHINFNRFHQESDTPTMDGFVVEAAAAAKFQGSNDTTGVRAMGFYNSDDLISHYFLATQFAVSDRWFAPAPIETEPNRMYLVAATSVGHAHAPQNPVNAPTIFDRLDQKGVSWKIYISDPQLDTELGFFSGFVSKHRDKFVPVSQYFTDVQNGTLPSVAYIDPGFTIGADEHPGKGNNIQTGAAFSTSLIKALLQSQSWKDSVFIMVFDEHGGLYDHVPSPTNVPSPDGITPQDLFPPDPKTGDPGDPQGNFTRYGFRIPNMIVSPFTRKHFVSHTVTDSTAILKFIETRFGLQPLTNRDALAMDMKEFFNFNNPPWATPPVVPDQPVQAGRCTDTLP